MPNEKNINKYHKVIKGLDNYLNGLDNYLNGLDLNKIDFPWEEKKHTAPWENKNWDNTLWEEELRKLSEAMGIGQKKKFKKSNAEKKEEQAREKKKLEKMILKELSLLSIEIREIANSYTIFDILDLED